MLLAHYRVSKMAAHFDTMNQQNHFFAAARLRYFAAGTPPGSV